MPRSPRVQYPGAVYHVMARGDGGKSIFDTDDDRQSLLHLINQIHESHGWIIHAYVIMGNHFHILLETPEPNLVDGMRYLMGVFSLGWNKRRKRHGHVFQGRYKAIPVDTDERSDGYFKMVADYIHLNPVRIGWVGGETEKTLSSYLWSSFPYYGRRKAPTWLCTSRVLNEFQLSDDHLGKKSYSAYLEQRAKTIAAEDTDEAFAKLQRGWFIGNEQFKSRLLDRIGESTNKTKRENLSGPAMRSYDTNEAEKLVHSALLALGLPTARSEIAGRGKFVNEKALVAALVRGRTGVKNAWLADRLSIGHPSNICRALERVNNSSALRENLDKLRQTLKFKD